MEEITFNDWPGQDLSTESHPWLPAYGFQPPTALLERSDFIGNPDAEYFLQSPNQYMYLETIQEENSDDLHSESDVSDLRGSPLGWLATDSESGSVICIEPIQDTDCESDREIACPAKRRRQDNTYLTLPTDEDCQSLSRSSSLLQFETLEKQCQETSSSSPSIFSQFSIDSLENHQQQQQQPSRGNIKTFASIKFDQMAQQINNNNDASDSSDTGDSEATLEPSKSITNLKTWHSFDNLPNLIVTSKVVKDNNNNKSVENLSEDSGYGDVFSANNNTITSTTTNNISFRRMNKKTDFLAYDCEVFQKFHSYSFGTSYQNLSVLEDCDLENYNNNNSNNNNNNNNNNKGRGDTPLIQRFLKNWTRTHPVSQNINLDLECGRTKYNCVSASEPNLLQVSGVLTLNNKTSSELNNIKNLSQDLNENVCVCSVPKDLNLIALDDSIKSTSIAVKNWDLADCFVNENNNLESLTSSITKNVIISPINTTDFIPIEEEMAYKREGSYDKAMSNRVDLSDDENSLCYKKKIPKHPIVEFDKKVLSVISESISSLNTLNNSTNRLNSIPLGLTSTPISEYQQKQQRNVASTPNLSSNDYIDDTTILRRKSSILASTSTSGMSDLEDKTINGSTKGVHFSPVVSEVNWRDSESSTTLERESSNSLSSSPDEDLFRPLPKRKTSNRFTSQPDLNRYNRTNNQQSSIRNQQQQSTSQPNLQRRGSQILHRDKDGCVIKAYVDVDGIQYKHTHLDLDNVYGSTIKGDPTTKSSNDVESHVVSSYNSSSSVENKYRHAVVGMESVDGVRNTTTSSKDSGRARAGKLGVLFSRLTSFRFSNRKNDEKKSKKKNDIKYKSTEQVAQQQKVATKDDYIYIPLKDPSANKSNSKKTTEHISRQTNNNNEAHSGGEKGGGNDSKGGPGVIQRAEKLDQHKRIKKGIEEEDEKENNSSNSENSYNQKENSAFVKYKPPRVPPRVVGASVKKDVIDAQSAGTGTGAGLEQDQQQQQQWRQRRTTIDSGGELRPRPMEPMGLIETDLDTEVTVITSGANVKTRSLLNLGAEPRLGLLTTGNEVDGTPGHHHQKHQTGRPHKSMEFLLDKQNLKVVEPPENELQKGERIMSEHQLRVQRSLQKLNIPEWYKQSPVPREGFLLRKSTNRESRWTGTGSKTTSLSSLGSSNQSPVVLSPTFTNQPFIRWSTSKLNSTASSPCASTRSSFNVKQHNGSISPSSVRSSFSYRQPYLGWRSQERLSKPRTPAERLANSLLNQQQQHLQNQHSHPHHHHHHHQQQQQQESPEIQTSIKEVTSAIVHYVSGLRPDNAKEGSYDSQSSSRSRSVSPRGSQKLCWLESSFVGIRPLDSPQTPVSLNESQTSTPVPPNNLRLDLQTHNDLTLLNTGSGSKPSPGSTTLEDVLDSLLGLPSSDRAASPNLQVTASANTSPSRTGMNAADGDPFRRRSEGNDPVISNNNSRRVSFNSSPILQCRYSRCGRTVLTSSPEAALFKNCHNCSYTYCSRSCRRAHWEKHRKTCLFSRIGSLCRQIIATAKEQNDTLQHLSIMARRGYLSQGLGAVKCFFSCPEAAEQFLNSGLSHLGELTYVAWPDLLPSEMGPQLYAELVRMCKNYNPETKLVLYVSVCVVSETPATGAVKWERQLVSRCAKMRLTRDINLPPIEKEPMDTLPETLILTCGPIIHNNDDDNNDQEDNNDKKLKKIAIENVQNELKKLGISIKRQHPVIYKQLCAYVEGEKFTPTTVYSNDNMGKNFMCIIMLEADEESLKQVQSAGVHVRTVQILNSDTKHHQQSPNNE